MTVITFSRFLLSGVAVGALALAFAAKAEDAVVEDVQVGAKSENGLTRQEEKVLLKTPRSAGIVAGEKATEEHLERLSDFSQLVPNYRPNIANPQTTTPAIRGVGVGVGTAAGVESQTGFVVDNVFYKHVGFQWADYVELESFELGLGPQGTAGGKNTTVGNVIVRTQLPSFERRATFETSFANYTHFIEKLNVTGPVVDDKLAYRATFYLDKGDGWIRDQNTGAEVLNNNRWGARGQLLYVGENVTDRLIFFRLMSDEYNSFLNGPFGDSAQLFANGTLAAPYSQTLWSRLGRVLLTTDPYKPYYTRGGTHHTRTIGASNELNWQIGENTLTSITAWGAFLTHPHGPMTGFQTLEINNSPVNTYVDQYSQEFRFASAKDVALEWQFGTYLFYEKFWSYSHNDFGSDAARWYNSPTTDPALLNGFIYHKDGKSTTFQAAGFGQGTYHLDELWSLTFGLRDSYESKEGSDFGWEEASSVKFSPAQVDTAIRGALGSGFFDTGGTRATRNMLTGIFNPSFKYSDNILLFGLVGRGEKAGAANVAALPILSGATFKGFQPVITKAESNWDYELGAKTNWLDGKLIANFNLYWTDIYNFQASQVDTSYSDSTGQPLRLTYMGNVPHVRLRGFEFTGRWKPLERLWFSFNGAYTEARYIDYSNAAPPSDWIWPTPNPTPAGFVKAPLTLSRSNTRWENLPKWALNVGVNYEHPLGPVFQDLGSDWERSITGFGYVNLAWQDKTQLTHPFSVLQYWQPAYSIVNAGLGLRTDDQKYTVSLWAKNVFDQRYITAWSQGNATTQATVGMQNAPRYFGGTLLVRLE
ncbi:TonB-dependent receptor [Methylosinus sp. LW4]|uniref:TonB-dependent receptor n=1 Tax=Methylosinus sp. LW4 TaxID=136993 RepID=UPI00037941DB